MINSAQFGLPMTANADAQSAGDLAVEVLNHESHFARADFRAAGERAAAQPPRRHRRRPRRTAVVKFSGQHAAGGRDRDREGQERQAVEGLTAKDFTITEDGVAQTISFCEFQKLDECGDTADGDGRRPAAAPTPHGAGHGQRGGSGVTAHQITPETPGDIRYRDRRLMAMYFDMSAMPVPDQIRALDGGA